MSFSRENGPLGAEGAALARSEVGGAGDTALARPAEGGAALTGKSSWGRAKKRIPTAAEGTGAGTEVPQPEPAFREG